MKHYLFSILSICVVTLSLFVIRGHVNSTTVALCLLLVVLVVAATAGGRPAYLAAILGVLSFNFFFFAPYHTFVIADPQNWVALAAFLMTALIAGELSARVRRRAEEAETRRQEIERLYNQLQDAFERASEAEAFKRSERLKSALLDAVTHHLRTPLTSMKAAATTLLSESGQTDIEGQKELYEIIDHEADRLNRFVESLVEIARIEAGQMELSLRWVSLDEIIANALHRASRQSTGHAIDVEVEQDLPPIRVDAGSMSEVLYILLENAIKYSSPGSVVRIEAGRYENHHVRLAVDDQGRGIPESLRGRVFDKFFRIADGESGKADGLGMGLAIARGIVEAHGGKIWIEPGKNNMGTRMVVELTVLEPDQQKSEES